MGQAENFQLMEDGREATLVEAAIKNVIDDVVRIKVSHLISVYRNGSIDHDLLVGGVAEIAALEGLLAELDSRQRRGVVAANKELNHAPKS